MGNLQGGRREADEIRMTRADAEIIKDQQLTIEKLTRKVKRLEKRLLSKAKYEKDLLINTGATPKFITGIEDKDREALR